MPKSEAGGPWWDNKGWKQDRKVGASLVVVGTEGCEYCKKYRERYLPHLRAQGYNAMYSDVNEWDGPPVIVIPHLYFFGLEDELVMQTLTTYNAAGLKKFMIDPNDLPPELQI